MLEQNPSDCFARYGLAMEHLKAGDLSTAAAQFEKIIATNPQYVAAYFHGGQTFEKMGEIEKARKLYESGIQVAGAIGDAHTRSELQAALDLL